MNAVLALDAGTTNVKAILVDRQANILARSSVPLAIKFPKSGRVEQSATEIWDTARRALEGCLAQAAGHKAVELGISNQRETLAGLEPYYRRARVPIYRLAVSSQYRNLSGFAPEGCCRDDPVQDRSASRPAFSPPAKFNGCLRIAPIC